MALSTFAISLGQTEVTKNAPLFLDTIMATCRAKPIFNSIADRKRKYHASEALFNVIKAIGTGIVVRNHKMSINFAC